MEAPRRRFKKRYIAFTVVLALAAAIGLVAWQAVTARPGPLVDYQQKMYDLAASHQPAGPDQWDVFARALAEMKAAEDAIRAAEHDAAVQNAEVNPVDTVYSPGYGFPDEFAQYQTRGRAWLASFAERGLFEHTAGLAGAATAMRPVGQGPLIDLLLPYLGQSRSLARIQAARMHLAAERGDWGEYTRAFEEMLATARIVASQTTLIDYLVGVAIEALALAEVRKDVVEGIFDDPADIGDLLAALDRQPVPNIAHAFEGERMFSRDFIQRVHTDDGNGDGRLILTELAALDMVAPAPVPSNLAQFRIINAAGIAFPSRAQTLAQLDGLFDPVIADARLAPHQRTAPFDAGAYVESLPKRQIILRLLAPAMGTARRTADQRLVGRAGGELLLRIERYRLQRGEPPLSLAELAAADHEADITDPMTGEPFLYTRLTGDAHGRPYLLYAPGADGRDDGGTAPEGSAEEAYRRDLAGVDYIVNPPPPGPDWDER